MIKTLYHMKTQKLPQTDSVKELARFWDTHDLTDFEEQLEEVSETVFERRTEVKVRRFRKIPHAKRPYS